MLRRRCEKVVAPAERRLVSQRAVAQGLAAGSRRTDAGSAAGRGGPASWQKFLEQDLRMTVQLAFPQCSQ